MSSAMHLRAFAPLLLSLALTPVALVTIDALVLTRKEPRS